MIRLLSALVVGMFVLSLTAFAQQDPLMPRSDSPWGKDDEIGAANHITPSSVLTALKLVKTGQTYHLGVAVDSASPAFGTRNLGLTVLAPGQQGGNAPFASTNYNDDLLIAWLGIGSQIDGLGHIGYENVYYNGLHAKDFADYNGLKKLGVEKIPPIVARGVVLDMAGMMGVDVVPAGTAFNQTEIERAARRQKVTIGKGDVVLFHTGWLTLAGKDDKAYLGGEPGLGVGGSHYLARRQVVAIGADNWGLEVIPAEASSTTPFEVHVVLLAKNGIYILENMNTGAVIGDMRKDGRYDFLFVLGAARVRGAVQMIVDPIAIR